MYRNHGDFTCIYVMIYPNLYIYNRTETVELDYVQEIWIVYSDLEYATCDPYACRIVACRLSKIETVVRRF